jgi:hypothetical protein
MSLRARRPRPPGCDRDARRAHRRRQAANEPPGSAEIMPRGRGTTAAAASRIDQDAAALDSGGAGPGLGPERTIPEVREELPDDSGIVQRGDQPQPAPTLRARQNIKRERPLHQPGPAPGARTALRRCALRACDQRRSHGRGLGHHASVCDHARARTGPRSQQTMADQQVRLWPRRHRRETLQQLQRLEHQLPRAVVPRLLQLERDAPVAP